MVPKKLLDAAFESGFFPNSRWSVVEVETGDIPEVPEHGDPVASMYADVSWFELGHLLVGERCRLTGDSQATFWKIEEDTLICQLPDGRTGTYTHSSDADWEERRWRAERLAIAIMRGEKLNE